MSFVTNASLVPSKAVSWAPAVVGNSGDSVAPVTKALPTASTRAPGCTRNSYFSSPWAPRRPMSTPGHNPRYTTPV